MAIECTKVGRLPEELKFGGKCTNCLSEYKANRGDLHYDDDQRGGGYWIAACVLCKRSVYFTQIK